ncbi:MAG: DUF2939 domain-containing protein [Chthoniobacterales bacterium]
MPRAASFLLFVLLIYVASPYYSFWRFTQALKSTDRSRLELYVDFPSVRQSLKEQLRAKLSPPSAPAAPAGQPNQPAKPKQDMFAGLLERVGPSLIDQLVDAFVTPDGLAALIGDPKIAKEAKAKNPAAVTHLEEADKKLDWSEVKYAFFTGPKEFLVDVDDTKLHFRFTGFRWKLKRVELAMIS